MGSALYVGLMSGTSMDGVDAALCEFVDGCFSSVVDSSRTGYSDGVRRQLLRLQSGSGGFSLRELASLDHAVATTFAEAAMPLCRDQRVSGIGSHGQTIFHDPEGVRNSIQIGNPNLIAARTGVPVVADFRRADIALGGQGAPLVPAFHHAAFSQPSEPRCIVNIGGIANITLLPGDEAANTAGWDTGPGNCLMDEWVETQRGQKFDAEGAWALTGTVNEDLLYVLQSDDYFKRKGPKSTGRDYFNAAWVRKRFTLLDQLPTADVQRTLCELTARSITQSILHSAPETHRILVCGGGTHNRLLMTRLQELLPDRIVASTDQHGLPAGLVEAAAFAWLAMRRQAYLPGNLPSVTGASRLAVLGAIYSP